MAFLINRKDVPQTSTRMHKISHANMLFFIGSEGIANGKGCPQHDKSERQMNGGFVVNEVK